MNEVAAYPLPPSAALLARFAAIVGEKFAITDPQAQTPYLVEMRDLFRGRYAAGAAPGLGCRGVRDPQARERDRDRRSSRRAAIPASSAARSRMDGEVVLSLNRLDRIREVDAISNTITCEAGVTLMPRARGGRGGRPALSAIAALRGHLHHRRQPFDQCRRHRSALHGIARTHALGIEVVLADGRVLNNLNKLKKDNTGYDLKNLFIGAEGTLGIITAAVLRLVPRPRSIETAFAGVPSPEAALDLLGLATERTAGGVTSFELMARLGIELVLQHAAGARDPLAARIRGTC